MHFGGKAKKRKAGGSKVNAPGFQKEGKAGGIPLLKHWHLQSWERAWWLEGNQCERRKAENPSH